MAPPSVIKSTWKAVGGPPKKKQKRLTDATAIIKHPAKLSKSHPEKNALKLKTASAAPSSRLNESKSAGNKKLQKTVGNAASKKAAVEVTRAPDHPLFVTFQENTANLRESIFAKTNAELDAALEELLATVTKLPNTDTDEAVNPEEPNSLKFSALLQSKLHTLSASIMDETIEVSPEKSGDEAITTSFGAEIADLKEKLSTIEKQARKLEFNHGVIMRELYWLTEAVSGPEEAENLFRDAGYGPPPKGPATDPSLKTQSESINGGLTAIDSQARPSRTRAGFLLDSSSPAPSGATTSDTINDPRIPFPSFPPPPSQMKPDLQSIEPSDEAKTGKLLQEIIELKKQYLGELDELENEERKKREERRKRIAEAFM